MNISSVRKSRVARRRGLARSGGLEAVGGVYYQVGVSGIAGCAGKFAAPHYRRQRGRGQPVGESLCKEIIEQFNDTGNRIAAVRVKLGQPATARL